MSVERRKQPEGHETLAAVIVAWNSGSWLQECLRGLRHEDCNSAIQILVVDNASTDGSVEWIANNSLNVELCINEENYGFARACNQGIQAARGRYILLLNPDATIGTGALDSMLAYMDDHPDVGILGPKLLNPDRSLQLSCRRFPTYSAALFNRTSLLTRLFPRTPYSRWYLLSDRSHDQIEEVDWVSGACMLVRREAIEDVGLLDVAFFLYCEDVDWCKRMWAKGWKVVYFPKADAIHAIGHSTSKAPFRSIVEQHKSIWHYCKKYFARGPLRDAATLVGIAIRCGSVLLLRGVRAALRATLKWVHLVTA